VKAIKEVSHDVGCRREIELQSGRRMNAVQLQGEYLEMAQRYVVGRETDPGAREVLAYWEQVLTALTRDPMELADQLDWVAKKALIEGFIERKGLDWSSPQVQMLDLQYHDLRPDKGLYYLLERQGKVQRVVTDQEIERAVHHPPEDTRAYFRGSCLRRYGAEVFGVNWDSISFGIGDEPIKRVLMAEPLKGSKRHVDDLFRSSPSAAELVRNLKS
jgi:proteasome accessory factor A